MFFDPLYDPLVVWRWAFQIEADFPKKLHKKSVKANVDF